MKMIGPPRRSGPKLDPRREAYKAKYALRPDRNSSARKQLSESFLDQLDNCKSEEARRILLGKTRKEKDGNGRKDS
jgi:hypothetical protein